MKKLYIASIALAMLSFASVASAHVIVMPKEAGIGSFQTFTMGVPTEEDIPTTGLRLMLPPGLQEVYPTAKPGWKITVKQTGTGDSAEATEIDWTGGSIPVGERDDFSFSAQVPATSTSLIWKAYQTYRDGSVVAWDQNPSAIPSGEEGNPYSVTNVIDDLSATASAAVPAKPASSSTSLTLSIVALALSLVAVGIARKK